MFLCKLRARKQISLHRDNKVVLSTKTIQQGKAGLVLHLQPLKATLTLQQEDRTVMSHAEKHTDATAERDWTDQSENPHWHYSRERLDRPQSENPHWHYNRDRAVCVAVWRRKQQQQQKHWRNNIERLDRLGLVETTLTLQRKRTTRHEEVGPTSRVARNHTDTNNRERTGRGGGGGGGTLTLQVPTVQTCHSR